MLHFLWFILHIHYDVSLLDSVLSLLKHKEVEGIPSR